MAWLVYIAGRLSNGKENLPLNQLVRRYPPPGAGSPPETPAPVPPSPDTPATAGATAAMLEVA